ncbi:MAG: hypothetical protein E7422_05345, partial [Ruminococcaceae bacterium]|nr:hypothetical protein [Oscillospiraceae bacterium]
MKNCKRIIPCFLILATLFSCVAVPVHAEEYVSPNDFYSWIASRGAAGQIISQVFGPGCSANSDGRHHAKSYVWDAVAGHYLCTCDACGETFIATKSELSDSYQQQVNDMPFSGIDSEGGFLWYPTCNDIDYEKQHYIYADGWNFDSLPYEKDSSRGTWHVSFSDSGNGISYCCYPLVSNYSIYAGTPHCGICFWLKVPVSGIYNVIGSTMVNATEVNEVGQSFHWSVDWSKSGCGYCPVSKSLEFRTYASKNLDGSIDDSNWVTSKGIVYFPVFSVVPDSAPSGDTYSVDSRPATINGNLNFYDIDGTLKLAPDIHIVNETNKTVYNPVTNETYDMSGWQYDYSTRSYNITTNEGDTVNVTYGDENITIQKGGETYNLYYTINNNGGGACQHEYVVSRENPPTCTSFGTRIYTCTKCNDTYSEVVPALGHDWQFVETVKAVTDERGVETTPAYDLYRCSRCNEEIKVGVGEKPSDEKPETPADA